jgi:hypothetical protein
MAKTTVPQYLSATTSIIDSGDATTITIDGSENVAIGGGTNHDGAALLISHGDSGVTTFSDNADELVIENSSHAGISILTPNNASGSIIFGDSDDDDIGKIVFNHADNVLTVTATSVVLPATSFGDANITNVGDIAVDTVSGDGDANTKIKIGADADTIAIHCGGADQVNFVDGAIRGNTNNDIDLGSSSKKFKDYYGAGTLQVDGNSTIGGTLGVTGAVTANAGVVVDNITIDGTEIDLSSGDLTIDVAGEIKLDSDGEIIRLYHAGTQVGAFHLNNDDLAIRAMAQDKDIIFKGYDASSNITALTLDMSDAGTATFNHDIILGDNGVIGLGASNDLQIWHDASNSHISNNYGVLYIDQHTNDGNLILRCDDQSGGLAEYISLDGGSGMVNMKQKTRVLTASPTILELETTNSSSYKFYIENRYDASNTVNFVWNTTTLMRFTSNYNALALMPGNDPGVAIGTYDDEGHKLNIYRGSSGNCSLKLKTSAGGDPEIHLDSAAANRNGIIKFFDNGSHVGRIDYKHNGDMMEFQAGSATGATFTIKNDTAHVGTSSPSVAGLFTVEDGNPGIAALYVRNSNADSVGVRIDVNSNASSNYIIAGHNSDGQKWKIRNDGDHFGSDTSIGSISDSRTKKDVSDLTYDIDKFKQYRPITFNWINPECHNNKDNNRGFLAQEVKAIDDFYCDKYEASGDDIPLVDEDGLAHSTKFGYKDAMYISVIKQLITRLETAEAKITALEE